MANLDVGKLTSVDRVGGRLNLIPAEVRGYFYKWRQRLNWVLIIIFLGLPWTKINGVQTIFFNIPKREFALFGILFRAHEIPLLFFILALLTFGLAYVTSLWGRIWCGWACPQTVFIESVFRKIEQWTEGNYLARRRLREEPMSAAKLFKVSSKWCLFILASILIGHSFMAYFVGADNLLAMMQKPPNENFTYFALAFIFSGVTLFDFAWFREQFCVIMCPYGRIQALLLDRKSLTVAYDVNRGEPRKGATKTPEQKTGDCVACNRCVQVCPTGIDIRNGPSQLECIACTACIDACDEIMVKVNKPTGLIKYATLDGSKFQFWKARSTIYLAIIAVLGIALTYAVATRSPIDATIIRGKGVPYSRIEEGEKKYILNQFHLHIQNQSSQKSEYYLKPSDNSAILLTVAENPIVLNPGQSKEWIFFVRFSEDQTDTKGRGTADIEIQNNTTPFSLRKTIKLLGPAK